ncbi:PaaI family thioesterase [Hellea balneolensis]|uniref:PaaI family thioesterase n=1 Tax=Hellea balneolensis TaxID=287478 RepID=UPI000427F18F|nr:PaaI family thioesterase [Hellea balneolensis]
MSKVSAQDMNQFFKENFTGNRGAIPDITLAKPDHIIMEAAMDDSNLRPGGFVSGPTQMALADHIAYAVIFTRLGITPMALTSNLNIDFLRPLQDEIVHIEGKMVKLGRSLAVIAVNIRGKNSKKLSSRATVTYALPQPS